MTNHVETVYVLALQSLFYRKENNMVKINGEEKNVDGMTLQEYLTMEKYNPKQIAVECNEEIVPKRNYETFIFKENDRIEIVRFVGGG